MFQPQPPEPEPEARPPRRRRGSKKAKRGRKRARRSAEPSAPRKRGGGETMRRILVAVPAIVFAIAITVAGGIVFMLAMIAIGVLCLREYLDMTSTARPLAIPAYAAVIAMVVAAHFGTSYSVLLIFAASFPVLFAFGADARHRDGATVSLSVSLLGIVWIGIPLAHAV